MHGRGLRASPGWIGRPPGRRGSRLVFDTVRRDDQPPMNRWSLRQVFVLILAVLVTTGMGLTVVRANEMALKMAMPSDMGAAGHDHCKNCPDGAGKSGAKATPCVMSLCQALLAADLHEPAPTIMAPTAAIYPLSLALLRGRALPPDPHPPRPSDIG